MVWVVDKQSALMMSPEAHSHVFYCKRRRYKISHSAPWRSDYYSMDHLMNPIACFDELRTLISARQKALCLINVQLFTAQMVKLEGCKNEWLPHVTFMKLVFLKNTRLQFDSVHLMALRLENLSNALLRVSVKNKYIRSMELWHDYCFQQMLQKRLLFLCTALFFWSEYWYTASYLPT